VLGNRSPKAEADIL